MNLFFLSPIPEQAAKLHMDTHANKMILETAQLLSTAHREFDGKPKRIAGVHRDGVTKWYKKPKMVKVLPEEQIIDGVLYPTVYMATHVNHPSAVWVRQSKSNYLWACRLMLALGDEHKRRHGNVHKSITDVANRLAFAPNGIPDIGPTPLLLATGGIDLGDPVQSYRAYYAEKAEEWLQCDVKRKYLKYTDTPVPDFMQKVFDKLADYQ